MAGASDDLEMVLGLGNSCLDQLKKSLVTETTKSDEETLLNYV